MARKPRVVIPECPHHVTQRGNFRQQVFYTDHDYRLYLGLLEDYAAGYEVTVQAYCLMPNHVHLIATPQTAGALSGLMKVLNASYARWLNLRLNRGGHLWQARFYSQPLDREEHLWNAMLYVEQNPKRAALVDHPCGWRWSSAKAHTAGDWTERFTPQQWQQSLDIGIEEAALLERACAYRAG